MKRYNKESLQKMVVNYLNGEESLLSSIIEEVEPMFYSLAHKFVRTLKDETVEDLIQDANIALIKTINKFDISKNIPFASFIYKVVENEFGMKCRKFKRQLNTVSMDEKIESKDDNLSIGDLLRAADDIEGEYVDNEILNTIFNLKDKYIRNQSEKVKNILTRMYDEDMNLTKVSKEFDCSCAYVGKVDKQMRMYIKKELSKVLFC